MFKRVRNQDGSYATRCLYCARMVAEGLETVAEVERSEARHLCPERVMAEQSKQRLAAEEPPAAPASE